MGRQALEGTAMRNSFLIVATEWFLAGKPSSSSNLRLPITLADHNGREVPSIGIAEWILSLLEALHPYLPEDV